MRRSWPSAEELLERYGLRVDWYTAEDRRYRGVPHFDSMGPSGMAGIRWSHVVVAQEGVGVQYLLHEGLHLVCARRLSDVEEVPEEAGLLQLERAVAGYLSPLERRAVVEYQGITEISAVLNAEVRDWKRPASTAWWRRGVALAAEAGLLTPTGKPTWQRHRFYEEPGRGYLLPA